MSPFGSSFRMLLADAGSGGGSGPGLFAWGKNTTDGALGLGDVANRSSPVQVGALTTWTSVSGGRTHTLALRRT